MKILLNLILAFCLVNLQATAQKKIRLSSPNGNLVFNFVSDDKSPRYEVLFRGKKIIASSEIGLAFNGRDFSANLHVEKPQYRKGVEEYELIVGKTKNVKDQYQEAIIPLEDQARQARVNLVVRAFDDGVAFRYDFIRGYDKDSLVLTDERTTFKFPTKTIVRTLPLPGYTSSHEGYYSTLNFDQLKDGALMDMPTLFELPGQTYVAVTEASLVDYAGMYLAKEKDVLKSMLSPLPKQGSIKVRAAFPHKSPWRVLMINDRIGALIESNIITDLNEPRAIKDVSWIKPGKTTFPWWNGNVLPDTLNAPGNNFVTQKYYIDFCARNGIEYHSVVEYGLHQWYVDDGVSFMPGPHSDATKAVPGLDMKQVCDYAKSKGVGVRVWVHWAALYPKIDSAFARYEKWGLQGMMVDFMDRDDQQMVNIQNEILEKAAQHHLHIQFHGAYKPTGLSRTYPNEFTREGTLNYEINKWDRKGLSPDHDIMIPFTRMLAGSTDYHLGGFRAIPQEKFITQYTRPLMLATRAHQLAMYVVLENYLGMVCDYPEAYEGQPGFDFLKEVPTVWDETKVVDARVGEYLVIARRKGKDWFVGAITNHSPRIITIPMTFLASSSSYVATIYSDAEDTSTQPNRLVKQETNISAQSNITVQLAGSGGMVARIEAK
jgi:alpha-glucosidase